ncbi:unnamed protein product [Paramecium octaurelia]|uniref:RING-type domain-containing protein n=1 Tax=Paramecium octaurelia TaxID=43137 RepID=A0A8S1UT06_PAROT|nr:unnamed protein product [Paramecium octaurelia]
MQKEEIDRALKYFCFKYTYYNIFALIFSLFQYDLLPFALPIGLLIIQEVICWICFSKRNLILSLQHMLQVLAAIFIIILYYIDLYYYIFVNLFVVFTTFLGIKWSCQQDNQHEYSTIFRYLQGFYSISVLIASLCVTIKLNQLVNWTWSQTFWWYWMYLSALIGSAFTLLMILITKLINQFYYHRISLHSNEYKTLVWSFYLFSMTSVLSGIWIINTFNLVGMNLKLDIGIIVFGILIGFNLVVFAGTLFILKDISIFLTTFMNADYPQRELPCSPRMDEIRVKQNLKSPILLKKLSPSYFRLVTSQEFLMYANTNKEELFTERANNLSQNIIRDVNQEIKRIKKSKQKTDIVLETQKTQVANTQCIICCEKQANAVLMKCGHGGICYECAFESAQKSRECFLCRQRVIEIYEIDQNEQGNYLKVYSKTRII